MEHSVCIVTAGDPQNPGFDYRKVSSLLVDLLQGRRGVTTLLADNVYDAITKLCEDERNRHDMKQPQATMTVLYISSHFCEEAIQMSRLHSPRVRFIVYTIGTHHSKMPLFLSRDTMNAEALRAIFW
jgi:hypothetical protein